MTSMNVKITMAAFPSKNKTSLQLEIVHFSIISQNIFAAAFNMTSLTADWLVWE